MKKFTFKEDEEYNTQILVICEGAYITTPIKFGKAEVFPFDTLALEAEEASKIIYKFCHDYDLNTFCIDTSHIIDCFKINSLDRSKKRFGILFSDLLQKPTKKDFNDFLREEIKKVLAVISFNRSAYPEPELVVLWRRGGGMIEPIHMYYKSYYRGNIAGGAISGEGQKKWNDHFNKLENNKVVAHIVDRHRHALREGDIEIAYLRYWSILEAITYHLKGNNKLPTVKETIREVLGETNFIRILSVKLGEIATNPDETILAWYNARNYTAHNGGFLHMEEKKRDKALSKAIENNIESNPDLYDIGTDRLFFALKDTTRKAIQYLLEN